jgi:hypothetical protein
MLDQLYLAMPRAETAGRPWRARLTEVAAENKAFFERHPWAAEVSRSRPPLGPGLMAKYEHELRAFDDAGLDEAETDAALTYLLGFVQSSARAAADARAAIHRSAQTDAQWWEENGPLLTVYIDPSAYPTAARVGPVAGEALQAAYNPDHAYEFGLQRVLDGLGVLIEARAADRRDGAGRGLTHHGAPTVQRPINADQGGVTRATARSTGGDVRSDL